MRCQRMRAVAVGGDDEPAVAGDVHRPGDARHGLAPERRAARVEGAQRPLGAEDEAVAVGVQGEAARRLEAVERQGRAGQGGACGVLPALDGQALLARRGGARVRPGADLQREAAEVEARRVAAP